MNKKKIPEKKRKITLSLLIALMLLSLSSLVAFGIIGIKTAKSVNTADYSTKSEIKYELNFREDPFYNRNTVGFGNGYVTKFIDSIDLSFLYDLKGKGVTDLGGTYYATARLEATYNDKDLVWTKDYELVPQTDLDHTEQVSLPLQEYINLAKNIQLNTGVTSGVKMTVSFTADASAMINGEQISDKSEATLIIPITNDVLVMEGTPLNEQAKSVESVVQQEFLPKKAMLIVSIVFFLLFTGAFCLVYFLSEGVKTAFVKLQLKRIYKKYGGRIIEMDTDMQTEGLDMICVKTFRDLLLLADQSRKSILKNNSLQDIDTEFYVFDRPDIYVFKAALLNSEVRDFTASYTG